MNLEETSDSACNGVSVRLADFSLAYESKFGPPRPVLERISFEAKPSKIVAILGPSGCGKTTLLKAVAGLLDDSVVVSQGSLLLDERPREASQLDREIGFVFQKSYLFPWKTARENVGLARQLRPGTYTPAQINCQVEALLESAGLENDGGKYPWELSGGMQQRVALLREFLKTPNILLMDEPFGGLDRTNRNHMCAQLLRLCESSKPTVLLVTHDPDDAVFLADNIYVFSGMKLSRIDASLESLPRPRDRRSPEFQKIVQKILNMIGE